MCKNERLNVCSVDTPCGAGHLDLVCYFRDKNRFDCSGRVWVELKTWGRTTFEKNYNDLKSTLPAQLEAHRRHDSSLCAVLLVAAKVERVGAGWGTPQLFAELCKSGSNDWCTVGSTAKAKGRGQVRGPKAPLSVVLGFLIEGRSPSRSKRIFLRAFTFLGWSVEGVWERAAPTAL